MRAYLPILLVLAMPAAFTAEPAAEPRKGETAPPAERAGKLLDAMDATVPAGPMAGTAEERRLRGAAHYANGKRFYEARLFPEARQQLDLAVQLDPASAEAKELLRLTEAVLAVRRSRIKTAVEQLAEKDKVVIQEQLNELQNHLDRARVLYAGAAPGKELSKDGEKLSAELQQLEESDRQLSRAREIAKWMNARIEMKDFDRSIETLQEQVFKERKRREATLVEMGRVRAADEAVAQRAREEDLRRRQIRMLMDKADMLYARRDYDEAGRLCHRVMELDPTNTDAVVMEVSCRKAAINKRRELARDLNREAKRDWVELSGAAMVPHSQLLVYPRDWAEISRRESIEEKRLQEPDWKKDIRAALEKEVNLEFVDQPLAECIKYLQGYTDVSIIVDPAAFAPAAASAQQTITLRLSRTKLGLALKWILRMARLDYTLKTGAIYITTPDKIGGENSQKIYAVKDLTGLITNFPGPVLGLGTGTGTTLTTTPEATIVAPGTLQDMIKRVIQPALWGGPTGATIEEKIDSGQLIVFAPQEVHAQISQLLEDFRKSQTLQVYVEAKYLDVTQGFLEEIGVDWGGTPGVTWTPPLLQTLNPNHPSMPGGAVGAYDYEPARGGPESHDLKGLSWGGHSGTGSALTAGTGEGLSVLWSYFSNYRIQTLLRAIKKEEQGSILFAPRLTMFNNQRAHILVGRQQSYISGWSGTGNVATPTVATAIMDGVSLDVRPIVSHDRRYITLELRPTLVRPSSTGNNVGRILNTTAGLAGSDLEFLLPVLEIRTIRTVATVPDGGTVLLSGLMKERQSNQRTGIPFLMDLPVLGRLFSNDFKDCERRNLLILVTAKLILFAEEEQKL